jgi:hypothetical protein
VSAARIAGWLLLWFANEELPTHGRVCFDSRSSHVSDPGGVAACRGLSTTSGQGQGHASCRGVNWLAAGARRRAAARAAADAQRPSCSATSVRHCGMRSGVVQ